MTIKEYLNQYRRELERVREMDLSIQRLEDKLDVQAIQYDKDPAGGGSQEDKVAELVSKICDIKMHRSVVKTQALLMCAEIEDVIDQVKNPDYSRVLYDMYVLGRDFETIADEMHASLRQVYRWHGEALLVAEKIRNNSKVGSKWQ